ncbi:ADP-dependent phosphofructokinase [Thermococcus kodakarensis KOD1]|uniref:ADP-specific phosphofructokinase n=1 Tax=Thermococcus kodakarensis (strain ATCC BAA-918 / JCM 12380 / KOD1) TaxID=69014 RepID=K6PF_THEKO|nr:ADP-specific phosphofructokinase [Thermococcus kodakarensis]Q5JD05.1 RecName: Full=ADP-specific phosphofructokinase; AltName: Full=ADP-dependent phosphofructokinase; Short=ADP-Pfk [Thermococcus kodakarensis KOD1]WCN28445.1 ADP-specific phosphofructokinase [Thermococcus kodakarensis]WCN30741.1 ADP-specific phosphofructokinase [Thermococcus kodakarensis]BAD84565.1 ADP-dependent phosphofructokinase [Thermococcus kodakarensis KOD1]
MVRELLEKARGLSMFTAYNTNVDAIVYLNGETVQRLIDEFGAEAVKRRMEEYPREINEPLDFVARLVHALKTGKPMAVPLVNEELQAWFDSHFKYDVERMGGQAGIIANLLANLDFREVLVYTPHLAKRQAEMFVKKPNLFYPVVEGGKLVLKHPWEAYRENDPVKVNRIFEFRAGTTFRLGNETITVPFSGRFIVSARFESIRIYTEPELKPFLPEIGQRVDGAILSGYQGIKLRYSDGKDANYYLREAKKDILLLKREKDVKVHLEFASIQNRELRKKVIYNLFPLVDSVGMDEAEIAYVLSALGYDKLAERIFTYNRIEDTVLGGKILIDEMNLELLQIHTIYYIMYIAHANNPLSEAELRQSLELATTLAASRASLGDIASPDQISVGMNVPYNERGEYVKLRFEEAKRRLRTKEYKLVIIPTRLVQNPVSTVGLGDTISTGAFTSYLAMLKEKGEL